MFHRHELHTCVPRLPTSGPWRGPALLLLIAAVLAPIPGWAQEQSLEDQALAQQGLTRAQAGWSVTLGAALAAAPRYPGASRERLRLAPLIAIDYDDRLTIGPLGIGLIALRGPGFRAGPVLGFEGGRRASDDPRLTGLGDIPATATAGLFAAYDRGPIAISATARQAISHTGNGFSGLLRIEAHHLFARTRIALGPDLEFGNNEYQQTWFGISPAQSAASGLREYTPQAGINRVGVHVGLTYRASAHVLWRAFARMSDLTGDAARSPIVERRTQFVIGAGIAYHF
ncbi:MAG: MipA/OmpV family protein [Steroidobacteraceae bacterium]